MADLSNIIKTVGVADKASNFLGLNAIPPAAKDAMGFFSGIMNPYGYLTTKALQALKEKLEKQNPEMEALKDAQDQMRATQEQYEGMMRNQFRDFLPESIASNIPQYQAPIYNLEQMGIDLEPFSPADLSMGNTPNSGSFEYMPNLTPQESYNIPDMGEFNFNPQPMIEPTYGTTDIDYGQYFNRGGIASLRRKA